MDIDHHLQQAIIELLKQSSEPVRYTDLKDPAIENSLFSHHLNKLLTRGMVQKIDDGYSLTVEGARWLNDNGSSIKSSEAPRIAVALVIQDEAGNYLIGQRTGQMKATINDYITPSVRYSNDEDLPEQVQRAITKFIPEGCVIEQKDNGFVQLRATYIDDVVMRVLFHVTAVQVRHFEPMIPYEWLSREQINIIDHPSARILQGLIDYVDSASDDISTPVITG